jgi:hypothetical protein
MTVGIVYIIRQSESRRKKHPMNHPVTPHHPKKSSMNSPTYKRHTHTLSINVNVLNSIREQFFYGDFLRRDIRPYIVMINIFGNFDQMSAKKWRTY